MNTPVCSWIGVTCGSRHQRVIALTIPEMGLKGTIPPEIGNLSFLKKSKHGSQLFWWQFASRVGLSALVKSHGLNQE